jgi:hypothetical protein
MANERPTAKLDLGGFRPKPAVEAPVDETTQLRAIEEGKRLGFDREQNTGPIDGRVLRRRGNVQMNMKVAPETVQQFKQMAAAFGDQGKFLAELLRCYKEHGHKKSKDS